MANMLVDRWRDIIQDLDKSWVLFKNGTCVIIVEAEGDLADRAIELMKAWGPVQVATPSADFDIFDLITAPGWIVTCHHRDILTYVAPDEMTSPEPDDILIGLLGRSKRDQDAQMLEIIHVEDRRIDTGGLELGGSG